MSGLARALGAGVVSGGAHALALRTPAAAPLAWVALVPLLVVCARGPAWRPAVAALAYVATLFHADVTPWLAPAVTRYFGLEPGVAAAFAVALMSALAAGYAAAFGSAIALRRRTGRPLGVLWCAALWCVWEAARGVVPPYLPAAVLGVTQRGPVLQLASVTGIAGVTALVAATNAALAAAWLARRPTPALAAVAAAVLATSAWGAARLATTLPSGTRVLLVDGHAAHVGESTLERYIAATPLVDGERPALVVWPESALPVDPGRDAAAWRRLAAFVADRDVPLLAGGAGTALADDGAVVRFNSVHFVRPRHGMRSYHKRLLVPLAESWPAALGPPPSRLGPVAAGRELVTFGEDAARFGPLVCFEITHAGSARALARRGARFLVNVNNDVWFAGADPPHRVWAVVRAIETGRAVARASNGGPSAIVDPMGRVVAWAGAAAGPVALAGAIPEPVDTAYVRTGEVFLPACLVVLLLGVLPRRRLMARDSTEAGRRRT